MTIREILMDSTNDWCDVDLYTVEQAMKKYADYRVKQALDFVVDSVSMDVYDVEDEDKPEDYIYVDQRCVAIDYDSILNVKLPDHE